jgi:A/G-specific adenine glycosylase
MLSRQRFRSRLLDWYDRNARELPWRSTKDPYRIWVSEIMLQQTRVIAVMPYYRKFLERFPTVARLASARLEEVLASWSGLGYYARVRSLHRAAKQIVGCARFPDTFEGLRELAGVGEYTAAAVASIAFGLPHAVLDGNARRVLSRLRCSDEGLPKLAATLLDRRDPGRYNQALMELGATICVSGLPNCPQCPLPAICLANLCGKQEEFPARKPRKAPVRVAKTLLLAEKSGKFLIWKRQDFWEFPEVDQMPGAELGSELGQFRHSIMNRQYTFTVVSARIRSRPPGFRWLSERDLGTLPVSTVARKALRLRNMRAASLVNS